MKSKPFTEIILSDEAKILLIMLANSPQTTKSFTTMVNSLHELENHKLVIIHRIYNQPYIDGQAYNSWSVDLSQAGITLLESYKEAGK